MGKKIVSAGSADNRFVAISDVSTAADEAGVNRHRVLGKLFWHFNATNDSAHVEAAIERAKKTGEDQFIDTKSLIGGKVEHWRNQLIPTTEPAVIIAIATEITPTVALSPIDRAVLKALADGITPEDVAVELGVQSNAVFNRLARLRKKFGAKTNLQLMAEVGRQGIA